MSSSRPAVFFDCRLDAVQQCPWVPAATVDQWQAFKNKYDGDINCYAKEHNLHMESLRRMFPKGHGTTPLHELYIHSETFGDVGMPRILKTYCDTVARVLDIYANSDNYLDKVVQEQLFISS